MLLTLWKLVRRRWLTAAAGLFLAAAMCVWVSAHVQPEYRATGQMMFLLPPEQPDPEDPPVNPYLNLPEGMGATANLIAGMVSTDDVARSLADQGLVAEYTVVLVPGSGPVLAFDVTAADAETALATRDALMALVDQDLATLQQQAKTPAKQVMTATRPTVSQTAKVLNAPVYKAVAAAGAAGLLLALLLCLLVDRLGAISARSRRTRADATAAVGVAAKERSRLRTFRGRTVPSDPDPAPPSPAPDVEPGDGAAPPAPTAAADDVADAAADDAADDVADDVADDAADDAGDEAEADAAVVGPDLEPDETHGSPPEPPGVRRTSPRRRDRTTRRQAARPGRVDHDASDAVDARRRLAG